MQASWLSVSSVPGRFQARADLEGAGLQTGSACVGPAGEAALSDGQHPGPSHAEARVVYTINAGI